MPRSFFPLLIALSGVTGMVLAAAALVLRPPETSPNTAEHPRTVAEESVRSTVERFYLAVNHGIATGDTVPLGLILAGDYAEGDITGETFPAADRPHHVVRALHAVAPTLRVHTTSIVVEDDTAMATIAVEGGDISLLLGLHLDRPVFWGPSDLFRVTNSLVTERRSAPGAQLKIDLLGQTPILGERTRERSLHALQIVVDPGERWTSDPFGGIRLLSGASGTLAISAQDGSGQGPTESSLSPGGAIAHDGSVAITASNRGSHPAAFVQLSVAHRLPNHPERGFSASSEDCDLPVSVSEVLPGDGIDIPAGPLLVTSGRIILEPGARLAWKPGDTAVVLAVTSGTPQVQRQAPASPSRGGSTGEDATTYIETLTTRDVGAYAPGTVAAVENRGDSPIEFLVLTVFPAHDEAGLFGRQEPPPSS